MKKTPLVFSIVREQSVFMTVVISILTFLSVLALGIALSISTGVSKWNSQWDRYATVQVINPDNISSLNKIFSENKDKIESVREVSKSEMEHMLSTWVSNGARLSNYLPSMFEIKLKHAADMKILRSKIEPSAKILTHSSAMTKSISAGWKLVSITIFI